MLCHLNEFPPEIYSPDLANVVKVENCLDIVVDIVLFYIKTYKEKMGTKYNPRIISNGLTVYLDAANTRSYAGSGFTVNPLVGGIGGTLVNGIGFSSQNNGSFFYDGSDDYLRLPVNFFNPDSGTPFTVSVWFKTGTSGSPNISSIGAEIYSGITASAISSTSAMLI